MLIPCLHPCSQGPLQLAQACSWFTEACQSQECKHSANCSFSAQQQSQHSTALGPSESSCPQYLPALSTRLEASEPAHGPLQAAAPVCHCRAPSLLEALSAHTLARQVGGIGGKCWGAPLQPQEEHRPANASTGQSATLAPSRIPSGLDSITSVCNALALGRTHIGSS